MPTLTVYFSDSPPNTALSFPYGAYRNAAETLILDVTNVFSSPNTPSISSWGAGGDFIMCDPLTATTRYQVASLTGYLYCNMFLAFGSDTFGESTGYIYTFETSNGDPYAIGAVHGYLWGVDVQAVLNSLVIRVYPDAATNPIWITLQSDDGLIGAVNLVNRSTTQTPPILLTPQAVWFSPEPYSTQVNPTPPDEPCEDECYDRCCFEEEPCCQSECGCPNTTC